PDVYIADLVVRPDAGSGTISLDVTVRNATSSPAGGTISANLAAATGGDSLCQISISAEFPPGDARHALGLTVAQPHLWNLDDPFLYRVDVAANQTGATHQQSVRCGFRDLRVVDGYFHLNGKRIFLKSTHTGNGMPIGQQAPVIPD